MKSQLMGASLIFMFSFKFPIVLCLDCQEDSDLYIDSL